MTPPVLCIIQARYASTRLPAKMLLKLGDETLIQRAWRLAGEAFGAENCVVAIPVGQPLEFRQHLEDIGARVHQSMAAESDVLLRFYHTAHAYRWHPDTVLHRWTPDDAFKSSEACRRVVAGERLPVELGGEAFTLAMLDEAHWRKDRPSQREHITHALFNTAAPPPPNCDVWTVDTESDYERAVARYEREAKAIEESYQQAKSEYSDKLHETVRAMRENPVYRRLVNGDQRLEPDADPLAALRAIQESA